MLEDRDTWIDSATPETIDALYGAIMGLPEAMHAYFLLDATFTPGLVQWLAQRCQPEQFCSLYEGRYAGDGIEAIAPYLVCLSGPDEWRRMLYAELMALGKGKPTLSCLISDLSLPQLTRHLQGQFEAVDTQGKEFLLRPADTRAFAVLMAVLHPGQKRRMLAGTRRWIYVDRQGRLRTEEANAPSRTVNVVNPYRAVGPTEADIPDPENTDETPYVIDAEQIRHIQRLALPDTILRFAQLRAHMLGPLAVPPSVAHGVIDKVVQRLARHGVLDAAAAHRNGLSALRRNGCFSQVAGKI